MITDDVRAELSRAILNAIKRDGYEKYQREWNYYPLNWREPFFGHRRKIGWDLYSLLGISKGDFESTEHQSRRLIGSRPSPASKAGIPDEYVENQHNPSDEMRFFELAGIVIVPVTHWSFAAGKGLQGL